MTTAELIYFFLTMIGFGGITAFFYIMFYDWPKL